MSEFEGLLQRSGYTKTSFARRFGLHADSVSRWGDAPPRWALDFLRLVVRQREDLETFSPLQVERPKRERSK